MSSSISRADRYPLAASVAWFEWLAEASDEQRADHRNIEDGQGIWWEQRDDGVSVPGLFGLSHT
jgi:hypothetical protein